MTTEEHMPLAKNQLKKNKAWTLLDQTFNVLSNKWSLKCVFKRKREGRAPHYTQFNPYTFTFLLFNILNLK